jgi:hypothetical protein
MRVTRTADCDSRYNYYGMHGRFHSRLPQVLPMTFGLFSVTYGLGNMKSSSKSRAGC